MDDAAIRGLAVRGRVTDYHHWYVFVAVGVLLILGLAGLVDAAEVAVPHLQLLLRVFLLLLHLLFHLPSG